MRWRRCLACRRLLNRGVCSLQGTGLSNASLQARPGVSDVMAGVCSETGWFSRTPWWSQGRLCSKGVTVEAATCDRVANWRVRTTRLNRMCSWQGHLLHSGPGAVWLVVSSSRVVARCSCCRTDRRWACTSIVQPSSCLAVGRTVIVGSKMASLGLGSLSGGRRSG